MILAEKIVQERKKNGWTQEELAELMDVSRQSVSKWESAQSIPDIEKVIHLSELFNVTTDYLFKDELESVDYIEAGELQAARKVTLAEAQEFLTLKEKSAKWIALGVFLCILSPVGLIFLGSLDRQDPTFLAVNMVSVAGFLWMLLLVLPAVALFIYSHSKTSSYLYLNEEVFETEYGVNGMVKSRQKNYRGRYTWHIILSTTLILLSIAPLFLSFFTENTFYKGLAICLLLIMVAFSTSLFVINGIRWESMLKLLQEGDYSKKVKERTPISSEIAAIFWLLLIAIYLGYSFWTGNWQYSWIIWPVGSILYGIIVAVVNLLRTRAKEKL